LNFHLVKKEEKKTMANTNIFKLRAFKNCTEFTLMDKMFLILFKIALTAHYAWRIKN